MANTTTATPDPKDGKVTETALAPVDRQFNLVGLPTPDPTETALTYMARIMEMLPPQPEDVIEKIAAQILMAESPMEENLLWDATGSKGSVDKTFIFHSVHIQPSDHEDAVLPYFLVCKVSDPKTGEAGILTTGSTNICTSLVKAQLLGNLPWEAKIVGPKRKPKNGRMPLHLQWVAKIVSDGQ